MNTSNRKLFCKDCQVLKDESNTYSYTRKRDVGTNREGWLYFSSVCKECDKKRSTRWIEDNRDQFNAINRRHYYNQKKNEILDKMISDSNPLYL